MSFMCHLCVIYVSNFYPMMEEKIYNWKKTRLDTRVTGVRKKSESVTRAARNVRFFRRLDLSSQSVNLKDFCSSR